MVRFFDQVSGKKGLYIFTVLLLFIAVAAFALVETADAEMSEPAENEPGHQNEVLAGTATVEVVTEPVLCNGGRLRFTGVPSGEITLGDCGPGEPVAQRTLSAPNLAPGTRVSTLATIDPAITQLGYRLVAINCDDQQSQVPSIENVGASKATFGIENGEAVTCTFVLSTRPACACPKEGRWNAKNHAGQMRCTGAVSLVAPLSPNTRRPTIEVQDDCSTLIVGGMSDDGATLTFQRTPQCGYKGSVGGEQDGIPMTIDLTLELENTEKMTGVSTSTFSRQGMTCNMRRTYEVDFGGQ